MWECSCTVRRLQGEVSKSCTLHVCSEFVRLSSYSVACTLFDFCDRGWPRKVVLRFGGLQMSGVFGLHAKHGNYGHYGANKHQPLR